MKSETNTHKTFMVEGIKNLLNRNYGLTYDLIDLNAEIDSTLTFMENWTHIKETFLTPRLSEVII